MNTIKFWRFWSIEVVMFVSLYVGLVHLGAWDFILANDFTYISLINLVILVLSSLMVGYQVIKKVKKGTELQWYMADTVLSLGMVGTLFGFLMVLYSTFQGIDVTDSDSMKRAIETLATSMGTALLTSLVGLISSIIMKLQLIVLETSDEKV
jgi:predicted deacetylase